MINLFKKDFKIYALAAFAIGAYIFFSKIILHSQCPFFIITHFPCAGCGMTRALILCLKGDFKAAFQMHAFIFPLFIFAIYAFTFRYFIKKRIPFFWEIWFLLVGGMVIYYIYRLIFIFPSYY